jgi:kelch-like protein 19
MLDDLSEFNTSLQTTVSDDSYGLVYENSLTNSFASNTELVFTAQHTHAKVFSCFKQFKDEGKLIDVQLKSTSNHVNYINAHKIILSGVSPYFQAQFCGGFVDGKKNLIELDINFPILSQIVEFMYTMKILVNEQNVQNLLQSAKLLHVDDIVNACCLYLYLNMDSTNVLGIHDLAETYALKKLLQQAINYVNDHFEEIVHGPEFLGLNEHKLCQFLSCDQLKVKCESSVFNALLAWVKHDIDTRRMSLEHLFQCVRFHYVPPSLLKEQIQSSELFKRSDMCKFKDCLQQTVDDLISHRPCPYSNRKPFIKFALYVFGGYQRQSLNMVETFKLSSTMGASWERCDNMRHARSGVACVTSSFLIFIIGGRNNTLNGNTDCADVDCFDPLVNSWRMCSPMSVPRSRPSG